MKQLYSIFFALILLVACDPRRPVQPARHFFDGEERIHDIGKNHNEMVIRFLNEVEMDDQDSYHDKLNKIRGHFLDQYEIDIVELPNYLFKDEFQLSPNLRAKNEFDPYGIVANNKHMMSDYFHKRINGLLQVTEEHAGNPEMVIAIIEDYEEGVMKDDNFSEGEKNAFLNMLDVHRSSVELWTTVFDMMEKGSSSGRLACKIRNKDAWKIPAADWTGGIFGAVGTAWSGPGALLGAVVGLVSSSITMTIGVLDCGSSISKIPRMTTVDIKSIVAVKQNNINFYEFSR